MSYDKINIIYMSYDKDQNKFKEFKSINIKIKPYKLYLDEKKQSYANKEGGDIFDDFDNNTNSNNLNGLKNFDSSFDLNYLYDNNTISDVKKYISKKLEKYDITIPFECQYLESMNEFGDIGCITHEYKFLDKTLSHISSTISINDIFKLDEESINVLGIKVDYELVNSRESYTINNLSSKKIKRFLDTNGHIKNKGNTIYLYNIINLIESITDVSNLNNLLSKDRESFNLFYYGFLEKYLPIIPIDSVRDFLFNKNIYKSHPEYSIMVSNIYRKIILMDKLNKNLDKKLINEKQLKNIESVILKFYKVNSNVVRNNLHVMKLYNCVDLDNNIVKIEVFIKDKNIFLEKVYKNFNDTKLKKTEIALKEIKSKQFSYICFYIKIDNTTQFTHKVIIYSNGNIEATILNTENYSSVEGIKNNFNNKIIQMMYDFLYSYVKNDANIYLDIKLVKSFIKVSNITFSTNHEIIPEMNTYSDLFDILKEHELLEEYSLSNSEVNKDKLILFLTKKSKAGFKLIYNDFHEFNDLNSFYSKSNIVIHIRLNDIELKFNNIEIDEFRSYMGLCGTFINYYKDFKKSNNKINKFSNIIISGQKKIKILKQTDPVLYNYDKENKYSRLCQLKQQPIIINKSLAVSKYKNKSVKYWNFTKGQTEYYACDSKEYPHLKFITGNHPKDFCLPCCKKKMVEELDENNSSYREKHEICLANHSYNKNEKVSKNTNRYVSLYSCKLELEEYRLMKLSNTLNKLFYTFGKDTGENELYILGINSFSFYIESYLIKILSLYKYKNLDSSIDIILDIIDIFSKDNSLYYSICDGVLTSYFRNFEHMIDVLYTIINGEISLENMEWLSYIPWDDVIIELYSQLGVQFIHIYETDNNTLSDSIIDVKEPNLYLNDDDYIILVHREIITGKKSLYPIVKLNISMFYVNQNVDSCHFKYKDKEILSIEKICSYGKLEKENKDITLDYNWIIGNKDLITLKCIFINNMNEIFAICFDFKGGCICINVEYIKLWTFKKINIEYSVDYIFMSDKINIKDQLNKYKIRINDVLLFSKLFSIELNLLILNKDNKIISGALNDYLFHLTEFQDESEHKFKSSIKRVQINRNELSTLEDSNILSDDKLIKNALYDVNMYNILLLHIYNKISNFTNTDTRKQIIKIFTKHKSVKRIFDELKKIIELDDVYKILYTFNNDSGVDINKKLNFLNEERYLFDSFLDTSESSIKNLLSDIVSIGNVNNNIDFDRNLGVCSSIDSYYCKDSKFILSKENYDKMFSVLVKDLSNEFKKKYILLYNDIHSKNNLNLYIKPYKNSKTIIHGV
jgi:hypothetical protein